MGAYFKILSTFLYVWKLSNKVIEKYILYVPYQRLELLTITPLSMEKVSVGNPAIFQALIFTGSPRVLLNENSSEHGIFFSCKK